MSASAKDNPGSTEALHATVRRLKAHTDALGERTRALETSSMKLRAATNRLRARTSRLEFDMEKRARSEPPPRPADAATDASTKTDDEGAEEV